MAYSKVGWKDWPLKLTKISSENLDHMDSQIKTNADNIGDITKIAEIGDGTLAGAVAILNDTTDKINSHITNKSNPHNVTASQVGLIWNGEWAQNIDVAPDNYSCGAYWVTAIKTDSRYVEGTHAFPDNFYYLFIFPSNSGVQFAVEYNTGRIKSRCYVNSKWQSWTGVTSIADGGTGSNTAAGAFSNIASTAGNITSPAYLLSLGSVGYAAGGGYTTLAQLKTAMALNNVSNTADSAKSVKFANDSGRLYSSTIDTFVALNSIENLKPYVYSTGADLDNKIILGSTTARWKQLVAATSTINTSDRNLKDNIAELTDIHKQFFMKLIPVSFTFIDGDSGRTHIGFISQDVEQAMTELGMTSLDFAGFCKDIKTKCKLEKVPVLDENGNVKLDEEGNENYEIKETSTTVLDKDGNPEYIYSLRYSEFIGIIAYVLQDTVNRLDLIEERLEKIGA